MEADIMSGIDIALHNTLQRHAIDRQLKAVLRTRLGREPEPIDIVEAIKSWFGEHFRDVHSELNYQGTGEQFGIDPRDLPPDEQNNLLEEHYRLYCKLPLELQTLHTCEDSS